MFKKKKGKKLKNLKSKSFTEKLIEKYQALDELKKLGYL
jgi:hypothetical protein